MTDFRFRGAIRRRSMIEFASLPSHERVSSCATDSRVIRVYQMDSVDVAAHSFILWLAELLLSVISTENFLQSNFLF